MPFYEGKFQLLSEEEQDFLEYFKDKKHPYYIIGVYEGGRKGTLRHEVAHALFTIDPTYREEVLRIIKKYDVSTFIDELKNKDGYHEKVLLDEVHAYAIASANFVAVPSDLKAELSELFRRTCETHSVL